MSGSSPSSDLTFAAPIEWIFIDVGGVLLDDTPLLDALYRFYARWFQDHGLEVSLEQLHLTRDSLIKAGQDQVYKKVLAAHSPDEQTAKLALEDFRVWLKPRQFELNPLLPGVDEALEELSQHWKLALAANQGSYIHDILEQHGIRRFFSQAFIAGDLGVSKPDSRFFEAMLSSTKCTSNRALMIGDSIPNDILPAQRMGMRTVLIASKSEEKSEVNPVATMPSATVSSLAEVPALLHHQS